MRIYLAIFLTVSLIGVIVCFVDGADNEFDSTDRAALVVVLLATVAALYCAWNIR